MREITVKQAVSEALREEMRRNSRVFIMGEDIGLYGNLFGITTGFQDEFGADRVRDTPMSEAAIAGFGVGAALAGLRPVVEIQFVDFATLAMDQIANQAAKLRYMSGGQATIPLVIRTTFAGGLGMSAQHSESLEAWFVHVPGLKVVMPSTPHDAKGLLKAAIRDDNPVVFIESIALYNSKGPVPGEEYTVPIGVADIKRSGRDVTVVAVSVMVPKALAAAEVLSKEGIEVEVVDPRTLSPLDTDTIVESVKKTRHLVITHQACKTGGVGAEIGMRVMEKAFSYLDAPIERVAGLDVPLPYASELENAALPGEKEIIAAVKKVCAYQPVEMHLTSRVLNERSG